MKPLKYILSLSLLFSMSLFAQNWSLVMPNDTLVYEKEDNHQFFTVWVDSTQVNGSDTTYFMNRISPGDSVALLSNSCNNSNPFNPTIHYNLHKEQFIGGSITKSGQDYSIDFKGNSYYFHPEQNLGSSWVFNSSNSNLISIIVVDTMFLPAFQMVDSIKIFSNAGFSLTLSKNHGIVEMVGLGTIGSFYKMTGVQNLGLGVTIPMGTDHFDYEIGDVFFRRAAYGDSDDFTTNKYMTTILSKSYSGDTLIYSVNRHIQSSHYTSQSGGSTQNSNVSTQILKYWSNMYPFLNAYPNTLALSYGFKCSGYSFENDSLPKNVLIYKSSDNRITRSNAKDVQSTSLPSYGNYSFCTVDSANLYAEVQTNTHPLTIKKGLGLVLESYFGLYSCEYELIGFIKIDGASWGDTTYISSVSEIDYSNLINIYPNPTNSLINITTEKINGISILEIYDLRGRLIITKTFERDLTFDVSTYQQGIYFAIIKNEGETVLHREKIIIQ